MQVVETQAQRDAEDYIDGAFVAAPAAETAPRILKEGEIPRMPLRAGVQSHRQRHSLVEPIFMCAVHRKLKRAEVERNPKATAAVDAEWRKLQLGPHPDGKGNGFWDYLTVREAADVRAEAKRQNKNIHVGMVAELCFEKNSELSDDDPTKADMFSWGTMSEMRILITAFLRS